MRRFLSYLRTMFGMKVERAMDPAVQIEQTINEARTQDAKLRDQAAKVIAHRTEIQMKLDRAIEAAAKAKQSAGQALLNLEAATTVEEQTRWQNAAQALAMELEAQERLIDGLKTQFTTATEQAELARQQVSANAVRLRELSAKRIELLGKLEQARMQEQVNKTLEAIDKPLLNASSPSLTEIEDKIHKRMAVASAKGELQAGSVEGATRAVDHSVAQANADLRLQQLRAELGIGSGSGSGPAGAIEEAQVRQVDPPSATDVELTMGGAPENVEADRPGSGPGSQG